MQKLGQVRTKDVVKVAKALGYELVRRDGSHMQFAHPERPKIVTVVDQGGKPYYEQTLKFMLDQMGLSKKEFAAILRRVK